MGQALLIMNRLIFKFSLIVASVFFSSICFSQIKISNMPVANPVTGAEIATLVQPGWNVSTCPNVGPTGLCNVQIPLSTLFSPTFPVTFDRTNITNTFTYGWGNTAVGFSEVANTNIQAQVMGSFGTPSLIATYPSRDSVGLFFLNYGPALFATSTGTFTSTGFFPNVALSPAIVAKLAVGMILDTNDATKYSGIITAFAANGTSITVSGWFQVGNQAAGQVPAGTAVNINPITKSFGANGVCQLNSGSSPLITACAGIEVDVLDTTTAVATNTTWGYDCNNTSGTGNNQRDCYIARGAWDYGFQANIATGLAGFYVPSTATTTAGFLYSPNTGAAFKVNSTLISGNYFNSPLFNVNFLGQVDIGSQSGVSASPIVLHSSGHAGADASITVTAGTGASDGVLTVASTSFITPPITAASFISGGTTFTVTGCGAAGSRTGGSTAGTFTVGTGAGTCTFVVTPGITAAHGWIMNLDDLTAHLHCTNTGAAAPATGSALCNATVSTSDVITFSMVGY